VGFSSLGISAARISSQLRHASQKVVEAFYRASFGGFQVLPEEVRELRRHLERAGASWHPGRVSPASLACLIWMIHCIFLRGLGQLGGSGSCRETRIEGRII
jgi:hypothetical protein